MVNITQKGWFHLIFWTCSFISLLLIFSEQSPPERVDVIYTLFFHLPLVLVVLWNTEWSVPRLLNSGKLLWYIVSSAGSLVAGVMLYFFTFDYLTDIFSDYYFISYYGVLEIGRILFIYLSLSTILELAKQGVLALRHEKQQAQKDSEFTKAQLSALKAQLHPHFLFNSLNTIYAQVISQKEDAADVILELSDLLRQTIEWQKKDRITLKDELSYLKRYIGFQRRRMEKPEQLELMIHCEQEDLTIAPLLLLPLIENLFQHADLEERSTIKIIQTGKSLLLRTENKTRNTLNNGTKTGMENSMKRLELLYPNNFNLTVNHQSTTYTLELILNLI